MRILVPRLGRRGLTMVELMLTVSITSAVTMGLFSILTQSLSTWGSQSGSDQSLSSATIALQRIISEVRDGKSASVSSGQLIVVFPAVVTDAGTGEKIYSLSGSSTTSKIYYISSQKLKRYASGVTTTLARGITSATFVASGSTVTVTITGSDSSGRVTKTGQVTGRVGLRNSGSG